VVFILSREPHILERRGVVWRPLGVGVAGGERARAGWGRVRAPRPCARSAARRAGMGADGRAAVPRVARTRACGTQPPRPPGVLAPPRAAQAGPCCRRCVRPRAGPRRLAPPTHGGACLHARAMPGTPRDPPLPTRRSRRGGVRRAAVALPVAGGNSGLARGPARPPGRPRRSRRRAGASPRAPAVQEPPERGGPWGNEI
jgi:hypothetical protein